MNRIPLARTGVGVEKLNLSKTGRKSFLLGSLQATCLVLLDIFCPPNFRRFLGKTAFFNTHTCSQQLTSE